MAFQRPKSGPFSLSWSHIWRPLKISSPKGEKLHPGHSSTIMQNLTPISHTSATISVPRQRDRKKELQQT